MNIRDFTAEEIKGDPLKFIFERQRELLEKYIPIMRRNGLNIPDKINLDDSYHQLVIKSMIWWIVEELGEAGNCLKNKPWKQSHLATDKDHFYEELIDAFHFFIELLIVLGITSEDLINLYSRKSQVNKFRIRSNY